VVRELGSYRGDTGRILSIESEVELGYLTLVREDWVERTNGDTNLTLVLW